MENINSTRSKKFELTAIEWRKINRTKRRNALTNRYAIGPNPIENVRPTIGTTISTLRATLSRITIPFFHSCLSVSRLIATSPPPAISSMALNSPPFQPTSHLLPFPSIRFQRFGGQDQSLPRRLRSRFFLSFFLSSQRWPRKKKKNIDRSKVFHVVAKSKSL